jgi:hypothetical protein
MCSIAHANDHALDHRSPVLRFTYKLDAIICQSRRSRLPDTTRKDLREARAELNNAARLWLWSLLFSVWTALGAW